MKTSDKWDRIEMENCSLKGPVKKINIQATDWEKISAKHTLKRT